MVEWSPGPAAVTVSGRGSLHTRLGGDRRAGRTPGDNGAETHVLEEATRGPADTLTCTSGLWMRDDKCLLSEPQSVARCYSSPRKRTQIKLFRYPGLSRDSEGV